jgi:hypothetical protein
VGGADLRAGAIYRGFKRWSKPGAVFPQGTRQRVELVIESTEGRTFTGKFTIYTRDNASVESSVSVTGASNGEQIEWSAKDSVHDFWGKREGARIYGITRIAALNLIELSNTPAINNAEK